MLHTISNQELEHLLTLDHPTWTPQAIAQQAEEYRNFLDDRLEAPLRHYLDTGKPQQFRVGEFSLLLIQSMRRRCSYFQAVVLMDAYLKDPRNGKALILRR
mgnify:CR=1 FL=1